MTRKVAGVAASLLAAVVLAAGCTSDSGVGATGQQTAPAVTQTHSPGTPTGAAVPSAPESATSETPGPYAAEIKAASQKAYSQFARDVMADGVITRQEYLEAVNRYKSCMADHGITVQLEDHHGYYQIVIVQDTPGKGDDAIEMSCEKGTLLYIGGLYKKTVTDPDDRGPFAAVYACLKRLGLTPDGYTLQQYIDDLKRSAVTVHYENGTAVNPIPSNIVPDFPFDMSDPRYGACTNNPQNPVLPTVATG